MTALVGIMTLSLAGHQAFAAESQGLQPVTLHIEGMTCGACVKDIKAALTKVSGVSVVEITVGKKWVFFSDYANARAVVTFDPEKVDVEALVKAVEAASSPLSAYKARLREK
jgi:mercuric ion binding protein